MCMQGKKIGGLSVTKVIKKKKKTAAAFGYLSNSSRLGVLSEKISKILDSDKNRTWGYNFWQKQGFLADVGG